MASVNSIVLVGKVQGDPKITTNPDGGRMAIVSLATVEYRVDKATKQTVEEWDAHKVVCFNKLYVDLAEKYLKDGVIAKVVDGKLRYREWNGRKEPQILISKSSGSLLPLMPAQPDLNADLLEAVDKLKADPALLTDLLGRSASAPTQSEKPAPNSAASKESTDDSSSKKGSFSKGASQPEPEDTMPDEPSWGQPNSHGGIRTEEDDLDHEIPF